MSEALDKLSPREREVLALVSKGLTTAGIALALDPPCAEDTVKEHLKRVFRKLSVHSRLYEGYGQFNGNCADGSLVFWDPPA